MTCRGREVPLRGLKQTRKPGESWEPGSDDEEKRFQRTFSMGYWDWQPLELRGQVGLFITGHKEADPVVKPGLEMFRLQVIVRALLSLYSATLRASARPQANLSYFPVTHGAPAIQQEGFMFCEVC